jgi:hypothetical protein
MPPINGRLQTFMTGKISIQNPGTDGHFLWKYLDLHRLIYFLSQQSLFFTRLDVFKDPYEGVKTTTLRKVYTFKDSPDEKVRKLLPLATKSETVASQRKQFVNSWFYGERESMAMWNLYSNPDSVALKIDFDSFYESLVTYFKKTVRTHENKISVIGDRISYFKLNPFDKRQKIKLRYSGFQKDISFEHEKEYRFLIYANPVYALRNDLTFKVSLQNFKRLPFVIITHPEMADWKLNNIKELVGSYGLDFKVKPSEIYLKK